MSAETADLWLVIASGGATYVWRGLGVVLSGRIRVESELFNWVACVAYAMIAGLIMRVIVMPTGLLAQTLLADRLAAFYFSRRNLFIGVVTGMIALIALRALRGVIA